MIKVDTTLYQSATARPGLCEASQAGGLSRKSWGAERRRSGRPLIGRGQRALVFCVVAISIFLTGPYLDSFAGQPGAASSGANKDMLGVEPFDPPTKPTALVEPDDTELLLTYAFHRCLSEEHEICDADAAEHICKENGFDGAKNYLIDPDVSKDDVKIIYFKTELVCQKHCNKFLTISCK